MLTRTAADGSLQAAAMEAAMQLAADKQQARRLTAAEQQAAAQVEHDHALAERLQVMPFAPYQAAHWTHRLHDRCDESFAGASLMHMQFCVAPGLSSLDLSDLAAAPLSLPPLDLIRTPD